MRIIKVSDYLYEEIDDSDFGSFGSPRKNNKDTILNDIDSSGGVDSLDSIRKKWRNNGRKKDNSKNRK